MIADWLLLFAMYCVIAAPVWLGLKLAAATLAAIQMHRLAILGHDGSHYLLVGHRCTNDVLANVFCLYMFGVTVAGYRRWHFAHHRFVGTQQDTELCVKKGGRYQRSKSRAAFAKMFLADLIGGGLNEVIALAWAARPVDFRDAAGLLAYWLVVVVALTSSGHLNLVAVHVVLVGTIFWAIFRVRNWSEHVGARTPPFTHRFAASGLLAYVFFPHNTWMHWEHHQVPTVPAHKLPKLRNALAEAGTPIVSVGRLFASFGEPEG